MELPKLIRVDHGKYQVVYRESKAGASVNHWFIIDRDSSEKFEVV
jgi:hypothetical protein